MKYATSALDSILKLPISFERVPVQNSLKWPKMGYNCIIWSKLIIFLPVRNASFQSKWWARRVIAKALYATSFINRIHKTKNISCSSIHGNRFWVLPSWLLNLLGSGTQDQKQTKKMFCCPQVEFLKVGSVNQRFFFSILFFFCNHF